MAKYHINPETGKVGVCTATTRLCDYAVDGVEPPHYGSEKIAQKQNEKNLKKEFGSSFGGFKGLFSSAKGKLESYLDEQEKKEFGTNDPEQIKRISEANSRPKFFKDLDKKIQEAYIDDTTVDSEVVDDSDGGDYVEGVIIEEEESK